MNAPNEDAFYVGRPAGPGDKHRGAVGKPREGVFQGADQSTGADDGDMSRWRKAVESSSSWLRRYQE